MKHWIITFFLTTICISTVHSQTEVIDSLLNDLEDAKHDTTKITLLRNLSYELANADTARAFGYAREAVRLADGFGAGKYIIGAYYNLTVCYYYAGEYKKALECLDKVFELNEEDFTSNQLSNLHNLYGVISTEIDQFEIAIDHYHKAISHIRKDGNLGLEADLLNNIGIIYMELYRDEEATAYFKKALDKYEKAGDIINRGSVYINLGDRSEEDSALYYYHLAKADFEASESEYDLAVVDFAIGNYHYKNTDYKQAIELLNKCIGYFEPNGFTHYAQKAHYVLGDVYLAVNNYEKSIEHLKQTLKLARIVENTDLIKSIQHSLSQVYSAKGDYRKAFNALNNFIEYSDSLRKHEIAFKIAESDTRFKNELQAKEIVQQKLALAQQENRTSRIVLIAILILVAVIVIFQFFRNKERTKKRKAQQALEQEQAAKKQLEEFDKIRSKFFANISHEFRTPLTLIKGPLDPQNEAMLNTNFAKYKKIMWRNCQRLEQLTNQLLDLSRIESGKMQVVLEKNNLTLFLHGISGAFESMAQKKDIAYTQEINIGNVVALFDADKLEKIINNVLSNAFKFTPEEGAINIVVNIDHGVLKLTIEDTGIGISDLYINRIFDRFYQVDRSDKSYYEGSGIGLSLTRELIEFLGGEISVESKEGVGSKFSIKVPLSEVEILEDRKTSIITKSADHSELQNLGFENKNKPLILLVEDNADVRTFLKDQLVENYNILEAKNGIEGLEKSHDVIPNLVISDVMMPEMDGIEFCKQLRERESTSHIPIIMLTAKSGLEEKLEGLKLGADEYLSKPFEKRELITRINNLLSRYQRIHALYKSRGLLSEDKSGTLCARDEQFLKKVVEVIMANYEDEEFDVVQLSTIMLMSRSQLHRKIKALTGQSPNELIRVARLQKAKALLENNSANTSEVAYMVGFNSLAYFSKCFKDHYGYPPSQVHAKLTTVKM